MVIKLVGRLVDIVPEKGQVFSVSFRGLKPSYYICSDSNRVVDLETGTLTTIAGTWNHPGAADRTIYPSGELHLERTPA